MAREFESVIRETQYIFEFMDRLPTDVKAMIASDISTISHDQIRRYFDEHPEQFLPILMTNMNREDRNRATFDFLLNLEQRHRTDKIIEQNKQLVKWTMIASIAAAVAALSTCLKFQS